ncbi:hypothetical protein [Nocardioides convexus]|uniref:hypothetical protein n=1 Tax=Nocardioides convexus TaxID=2712224 RepID=UPI002418B8A7|nr:hypothetical protein [Nocardioides convexus]
MAHLSDAEVEAISAEIARLDAVTADETTQVLSEFHDLATAHAHVTQGGFGFAQQPAGAVARPGAREGDHGAAARSGRADALPVPAPRGSRAGCGPSSPTSTRR